MSHRTVLQYQLGERIGAGGMGEIYKARDTRLNRFVAMKVLSAGTSANPDRRRRFIQEAQAVSALNHPNIITIYDVVDDGETQYMVIEYVDGKTLLELVPKGGLPLPQVLRYATQIAEALCAAHAAGIIHRDLKPSNVMVNAGGLVKVLDFGLAKLIEWPTADPDAPTATLIPTPMTVEGTLLGTVNYMSPEQAEGKRLDGRSDIFSFGAVLYEMLTGQSAFGRGTTIATLTAVLRDDVRPLRELIPGVPAELERIVAGCLKKDPAQRFQSMQEVESALNALQRQSDSGTLTGIPTATIVTPPPPVPRSLKRRMPWIIAVVNSVLTMAVAGGGYWWLTSHRNQPSAPHAQAAMPAATSSSEAILTNDNIVDMVGENVAPSLIVSQIRTSKTNFSLSPSDVIRLSKAGVPADIIEAMRDPKAEVAPKPQSPSFATVILSDGLLVHLTLTEDIPADAVEGTPITLRVGDDVRMDGAVVIRKGATATGVVVDAPKKKLLIIATKMTFRLDRVEAVDGQKLAIRATSVAAKDGISKRPVDTGAPKPKGLAASEGTEYRGYIDGAKAVSVKR